MAQPKEDEAGICEEKPELMAYLASLPDAEDEFSELEEGGSEDMPPEKEETPAQSLAEYIRLRSAAAALTAKHTLRAEIAQFDELLEELRADPSCEDICSLEGNKDEYFYSSQSMSDNYAMISSLVEEKDLAETIAKMVRFNCKTYPVPTPCTYFEQHPYRYTKPQLDRAIYVIETKEQYRDIKVFTNSKKVKFLYSEELMSERYAKALAEPEEFAD